MANLRIAPASAGAENGAALLARKSASTKAPRSYLTLSRRHLTVALSIGFLTLSSTAGVFAPAALAYTIPDHAIWTRLAAPASIPLPELAISLPTPTAAGSSDKRANLPGSAGPAAEEDAAEEASLDGKAGEQLSFGPMRVRRWIVETVVRAAEATGADPVYMMALADKESSFVPDNKARSSSAEGLFQFVEQTWFEVVREFGPRHGLAAEAKLIKSAGGQLSIADDAARERVLGLRRDAYLSAVMAAEMKKRDQAQIARRIGRDLNRPEYYLAHFMGAQGAARMLEVLNAQPEQRASKVFPKAAKSNPGIFYSREGRRARGLSVAEVYERIDRMIDARLDRYEGVAAFAKPTDLSHNGSP